MTTAKSYFQQQQEFAAACGIYKGSLLSSTPVEHVELAWKLVDEECNKELAVELQKYLSSPSLENLVEVADGIADSIYVLCQLAGVLGIPLDEVFAEVQRSNMAKVVQGQVIRREDGKILKPFGWTPPNIWEVLYLAGEREAIAAGTMGAENWDEYLRNKKAST